MRRLICVLLLAGCGLAVATRGAEPPAAAPKPAAAAAESAPPTSPATAETGAPTADALVGEELDSLLTELHGLPPMAGLLIVLIAFVPLLFGYRLIRIGLMIWCGVLLGLLGLALVLPGFGLVLGITAGLVGAILGAVLGRIFQKVRGAAFGAGFCAAVAAVPGALLSNPAAAGALALAGGVVGAVLGWMAALHLDAIVTSLFGASLAMIGASIAAQNLGETAQPVILCGTFLVAVLIGCAWQFRAIRRERRAGSPVSRRTRLPVKQGGGAGGTGRAGA